MSTIYTLNGKVLKNSANDKWLAKKEAPAGFVMDASNATISNNYAIWEGPNYPDGYDGEGKTLQITIKESGCSFANLSIYYNSTDKTNYKGPQALNAWNNPSGDYGDAPIGTYTTTLSSNPAGGDYGKYLVLERSGPVYTIDSAWLSKIEFRIID